MKISKHISAIDSHTMGEPARTLISGFPNIPGDTMPQKREYLEKNCDYLRTAVMLEPRGHNDMFGAIIVTPTRKEADLGIIFMDTGGYLNMCGHNTIAAMTIAVELGMVEVKEPITEITLEAPAGLVKGRVKVENGKAKEVSFINVPSFLYKPNQKVSVPGFSEPITVDVAFSGSFFALVDSQELGLEISAHNTAKISQVGMDILKAVNKSIAVSHPELSHIHSIDLVEIYGPPKSKEANYQNVVVFGDAQIDRSPCGTGTASKLATLFTKGKLKKDEPFVYESILETKFKGRVVDSYEKDGILYVLPEITGSAFITGFNQFVIDPEDPLKYGFILK